MDDLYSELDGVVKLENWSRASPEVVSDTVVSEKESMEAGRTVGVVKFLWKCDWRLWAIASSANGLISSEGKF